MVCNYYGFVVVFLCFFNEVFQVFVYCFYSNFCGFKVIGVFNYISVGIIQVDEVWLIIVYICNDGISDFYCVYFWFQVVGSYFWGRYKNVVFFFKFLFFVIVEEEGNVGVFFCFCNVGLGKFGFGNNFFQGIFDVFFVQYYIDVFVGFIVVGYCDVVQWQCMYVVVG